MGLSFLRSWIGSIRVRVFAFDLCFIFLKSKIKFGFPISLSQFPNPIRTNIISSSSSSSSHFLILYSLFFFPTSLDFRCFQLHGLDEHDEVQEYVTQPHETIQIRFIKRYLPKIHLLSSSGPFLIRANHFLYLLILIFISD